ncbi:MAG: hypothetical protein QM758_00795 [Armatimonas sp.]
MSDRFTLRKDGSLVWETGRGGPLPHTDKIETAGLRVAAILTYGAEADGTLVLKRHLVWPLLRTIPDNTHASLQHEFPEGAGQQLTANGQPVKERLVSVRHRGVLELVTQTENRLAITRQIFASRTHPACLERMVVKNNGRAPVTLTFTSQQPLYTTDPKKGTTGAYLLEAQALGPESVTLTPGASATLGIAFTGRREGEAPLRLNLDAELKERETYVRALQKTLILQTPEPTLNAMFAFAKVRAAESIYATAGGLMHGPGGGSYYAAIWANDQAEYANPFFANLGDPNGDSSALNSYRHFARFLNPEFRPIPSSIIAEGRDIWNGAGDRGDQAMIAYGAARYALTRGDRAIADELWPLITWCLEYLKRKTSSDGVIASDSDELEGRFPAGKFNLNTSCLAYDALVSASYLARDLGKPAEEAEFANRATALKQAIERYFGADVQGFKTYRYYDGNTTLRAWICTPLCMDLFDRAPGTLDALLSPLLWTDDGIRSAVDSETFWDRATLYAMRGALAAGAQERIFPYLLAYSRRRLLGEHVPYAIEAWPEGDQRHLSAESALYARIFTEGLLGFRPTGLRTFTLNPHLPAGWKRVNLKRLHTAGGVCDLEIEPNTVRVRGRGFRATPKPDGAWEVRRT